MAKIKVSKNGQTALAYLMILEEYSDTQKNKLDEKTHNLIQSMNNDDRADFLEGLYEIKKADYIKSDIELEEIEEDDSFEALGKYNELAFEVEYITEAGKDYFNKLMKLDEGKLQAKDRVFKKVDLDDIEEICTKINNSQLLKTITAGIFHGGNVLMNVHNILTH